MMHIREWFNFVFLALLLGSYALLALTVLARALAGLVRHRRHIASAVAGGGEDVMLNDTPAVIAPSHEAILSYGRRQRQSVTGASLINRI